ncbi:MAG: monoheme cytochrome SoxX [Pseudomonadota bacterium]
MFDRRLVLLATPRQIGVLDWRPGRMHWLGEFAATKEGLTAFRAIAGRHAHLPAVVVVDTVDEDYRSEILPHVQGRARDEVLARKLKQVFRNARFTGAWRQARETTGRRDDRYLFASLTDADWLTPWLATLEQERVPLAGIVPLALACQHLLEALRIQEPHVLVACRLNNRLRLSYYHGGLLRFSRLIGGDTPTPLPGSAADEIAKTQLYLTGQRILPREARLHVVLIDPSRQLDSAQAPLNADPAFSTRLVDLSALAQALRIPDDFLVATPESAPLAAIAGKALQLNLAPSELLQRHLEFRWRRGLHAAAAAIALVGVAATGAWWLHAQDIQDRMRTLAAERQQLDTRYREIARTFPHALATPEQLAQTVALARAIKQPAPAPEVLLAPVGQALTAMPDVMLDSLAWTDDTLDQGSLVLHIDAAIAPFDGNYRAAMQRIETFMQTLRLAPGVRDVRLRTSPVNADSASVLAGKRQDAQSPDSAARFSVELDYREDGA